MLTANGSKDVNYLINMLVGLVQFAQTKNPLKAIERWISTDADVRLELEIRALPNKTTDRILYFKLWYRKEILWGLGTSSDDLLNFSFHSNATLLPLDNAQGGRFDINKFSPLPTNLVGYNINPVQTAFSFIPTYSSLNAGSGSQAPTNNELTRNYSITKPPAFPWTIPFANYFSNPLSNEIHPQLTTDNGKWIFNEIKGTPQIFSCSYGCSGTGIQPKIIGAELVCSEDQVYTVQDLTPGTTLSWGISSNLIYVSGQGTESYAIKTRRSTSGTATLSLTINGKCQSNTVSKTLWAGLPASLSTIYFNSSRSPYLACTDTEYPCNVSDQRNIAGTQYFWNVSFGDQVVYGQYQKNAIIRTPSIGGTMNISASPFNSCGSGSPTTISVSVSNCSYSTSFNVFPNPSSSELTLDFYGKSKREIAISNMLQLVVINQESESETVTIDLSGLLEGFYYLTVKNNDKREQRLIQIKK
jgi:hypothetical protein